MKQAFTTHMDKMNYLKGLIRLSKSDGRIDPSEKAYFDYAIGSMQLPEEDVQTLNIATVYKGNIIKNLIMDCQSYTKYRPNETTGGIFVSWRRKEELPTGA